MDYDIQPSYQSTSLPINPVRIKICGLTNLDDALAAAEAGADLLGFIFYDKSPRAVDARTVAEIIRQLRSSAHRSPFTDHRSPFTDHRSPFTDHRSPFTDHRSPLTDHRSPITDHRSPFTDHRSPITVGVFVNPSLEQVIRTLDYCGLDLAQLHGEEAPELLAALPGRAFKALRPRDAAEAASQTAEFARFGPAGGPNLLVDAYHPTLRGGAGQTGDWSLAANLSGQHRLLLAGGLTPGNVAAAIAQVQPWGVDVASGVEALPGRKDHDRLRAFIAATRAAKR
ncbi:MAG: phosphoribosylanthranilate isomerase [Anaerolineae bacterium]